MGKEKGNEKETYRLWVEYLRQSEDYKLFCKYLPWHMSRDQERAELEALHMKKRLTRKEANVLWLTYQQTCVNNFVVFGNIHRPTYSFEGWWSEMFEKIRKLVKQNGIEVIPRRNFLNWAEKDIERFKAHSLAQIQAPCEEMVPNQYWRILLITILS